MDPKVTDSIEFRERVLYRERVWPSVGVIAFFIAMALSVGVVFGEPYGFSSGLRATAVSLVVVGLLIFKYSPSLKMTMSALCVGNATMPSDCLGPAFVIDKENIRRVLNDAHTSKAFVQTSPGIKTAVMVTITDPDDPHPFWLVSTRHPHKLLAHLERGIPT